MKELIGIKSPYTTILNPSMKRDLLMFDKVGILSYSDVIEALNDLPDELGDYFRAEYDLLLDAGLIFEAKDPRLELAANLRASLHLGEPLVKGLEELPEEERAKYIRHTQQVLLQSVEDLKQGLALLKAGENKITQIESNSIISSVAIDNLKAEGIPTEFGYLKSEYVDDDTLREFISFEYWTRKISILLREIKGVQAFPILAVETTHYLEKPESEKADVISIVLNALPIPNESTSWEQIRDYRNDTDAISNFLALRNWMNDVARAKLSPNEIEEKLRYLIDRYQRYIRLHEMKVETGVLETIVVVGAEFLENLVKFKWGEIAKGLFSIKHRRIALIEGELTAPGNEIAYIVKARNAFAR